MAATTSFVTYRGLSTDTKPTQNAAGSGPPDVGTRFIEIDTGNAYDWNGTAWAAAVASSTGDGAPAVGAIAPTTGTYTNRSGTITLGGTAQTLAAINSSRKSLFIQNNSTGDLWVNFTATAVIGQPSLRLTPGSILESSGLFVSTELVSIIGATTAQAFSAKES